MEPNAAAGSSVADSLRLAGLPLLLVLRNPSSFLAASRTEDLVNRPIIELFGDLGQVAFRLQSYP